MDNTESNYRSRLVVALLLWLGTWILVIPLGMQFPRAWSICGIFWALGTTQDRTVSPLENAAIDISLYLGVVVMLAASAIVMRVAREHKRTVYAVAIMDFIVAAASLFVAWYFDMARG